MIIKIGLVQPGTFSQDSENILDRTLEWIDKGADQGCDLILFPELWSIGGYKNLSDINENTLDEYGIEEGSQFIVKVADYSEKRGVFTAFSYLQKDSKMFKNSCTLINQKGKILGTYSKVHTCDFSFESMLTSGDSFPVFEINLNGTGVRVGIMICYDREFPEAARILMLKGAEIILVPNCCEMTPLRTGQLKSRSFENMTAIFLSNWAGETGGRSMAFDSVAYSKTDGEENTMELLTAGKEEELYTAALDMDKLRKYRKRETWGWKFRNPRYYSIISKKYPEG